MAKRKAVKTGKKRPKRLSNDIRKKLLTKEDGKTVPQTRGFYIVFVKGEGKNARHKAVAWEYLTESNWCKTKRQAIDKVAGHPRHIVK